MRKELYTMARSIKDVKKKFKEEGVFYTPPELAETFKSYIDFKPTRVYDPTCGCGNLLAVFDDDVEKFGQDICKEEVEEAEKNIKNFHGAVGDTLKEDKFEGEKFDCIVANPPFSIKWEQNKEDPRFKQCYDECGGIAPKSKADFAFILHCLHHLSDDGVAVIMEFPGVLYRMNSEAKIRKWLVENNYIDRVVSIPEKQFVDTTIPTCILVLKKNKSNTNVIFEDKRDGRTKEVTLEEIREEEYQLSVNNYIEQIVKKEEIDIEALNKEIVEDDLRNLKAQLEVFFCMEAILPEVNTYGDYYIEEALKLLNEYKEKRAAVKQNQ